LKEGKVYAADEYVNRLEDIYFPILKIIRSDEENRDVDYATGQTVRIYRNGELLGEVSNDEVAKNAEILFERIFEGADDEKGAFEIPEIDSFLDNMKITQIKAPAGDKVDIRMQIHDIKTGHDPIAGFSIKSDVGMPPTLLNAGKNTRFKYEILGINDKDMEEINAIDKSVDKEYMKARMEELFKRAEKVRYHGMLSDTYEDNLMMIDSMLPEIYGDFILYHYMTMSQPHIDCETLCEVLEQKNPLGYRKGNIYTYKIKKLLCASALGMTPGKEWDGNEAATGGYIIVKRDGDVVCYHLYNRNFFEEYLLKNTTIDRPSASRYDYAYVYKEDGHYYVDLNIQIRFKSIKAGNKSQSAKEEEMHNRIMEYARRILGIK
jgi:hypothetical protein